MGVAFANAKATHISSAKILALIINVFNNKLTNNIVSFEQLGPSFILVDHQIGL